MKRWIGELTGFLPVTVFVLEIVIVLVIVLVIVIEARGWRLVPEMRTSDFGARGSFSFGES